MRGGSGLAIVDPISANSQDSVQIEQHHVLSGGDLDGVGEAAVVLEVVPSRAPEFSLAGEARSRGGSGGGYRSGRRTRSETTCGRGVFVGECGGDGGVARSRTPSASTRTGARAYWFEAGGEGRGARLDRKSVV